MGAIDLTVHGPRRTNVTGSGGNHMSEFDVRAEQRADPSIYPPNDPPNHPRVDLAVGGLDRAVAVLGLSASAWSQLTVDFDRELDHDALSRAWRLVGTRFPIVRGVVDLAAGDSTFRLRGSVPPIDPLVEDPEHMGVQPGPVELAASPVEVPIEEGPLVRVVLVQRSAGPRLVWFGNHVLHDGASMLDAVATLAHYYREIVAGREPDVVVDGRRRTADALIARCDLGVANLSLIATRHARRWSRQRESDHPPHRSTGRRGYAVADITEVLTVTEHERRRRGWRTSAVLLALLARAWNRVYTDLEPRTTTSGWQIASDVRTELGMEGGLGNFSTTEPVALGHVDESTLESVVGEANREISGLASTHPGVGAAIAAAGGRDMPWPLFVDAMRVSMRRAGALRFGRSLTNIGRWPGDAEDWGPAQVTRGFFEPSFDDALFSVFAVQTVAGRTWMSTRTHACGTSVADVERLGAAMIDDARSLAR